MKAYQIIAGFSDIKSVFRTKTKTSKTMEELDLWFSIEDDVLYAHDRILHDQCIALAVYNKNHKYWSVTLKPNTYGKRLVVDVCAEHKIKTVCARLNDLYVLHGFRSFSRR